MDVKQISTRLCTYANFVSLDPDISRHQDFQERSQNVDMPLKRVHKRYPRVNIGVHEEKLFNFNKVLLAKYNTVEYYTTLSAGSPRSNKIRCYGLQIKCIYLILQEVYYWVLVNMMA